MSAHVPLQSQSVSTIHDCERRVRPETALKPTGSNGRRGLRGGMVWNTPNLGSKHGFAIFQPSSLEQVVYSLCIDFPIDQRRILEAPRAPPADGSLPPLSLRPCGKQWHRGCESCVMGAWAPICLSSSQALPFVSGLNHHTFPDLSESTRLCLFKGMREECRWRQPGCRRPFSRGKAAKAFRPRHARERRPPRADENQGMAVCASSRIAEAKC